MIDAEELELEVSIAIDDANERLTKSVDSAIDKLMTLRVGRASANMLDRVDVDYYGTPTPLKQLASVSAPSADLLVVDVYDKGALADVEKALMASDLGMTPSNDGNLIRLNVPPMTTEKRKELAKVAKSIGEDGKVALRNVRRDVMDKIKKLEKNEGLGEDASKDAQAVIEKAVKSAESTLTDKVGAREKEITTL